MKTVNYAFANVNCSIVGPNGAFSMGYGSGIEDGGITVEFSEDKIGLKSGADGLPMFTLYSTKIGKIMVRVQKNSPLNALLSALYAADISSPTQIGQNTIVVTDMSLIDVCSGQQCGIQKMPAQTYGKEGPMNEWTFLVGTLDIMLGGGG